MWLILVDFKDINGFVDNYIKYISKRGLTSKKEKKDSDIFISLSWLALALTKREWFSWIFIGNTA